MADAVPKRFGVHDAMSARARWRTQSWPPRVIKLLIALVASRFLTAAVALMVTLGAVQGKPSGMLHGLLPSSRDCISRARLIRGMAGASAGLWSLELPAHAKDQYLGVEKSQERVSGSTAGGKKRVKMPGFEALPSGLQVKDVDPGRSGTAEVKLGDAIVFTWEGYTINYFGRPYETRTLQKMAGVVADPFRFTVGDGTVIAGIDEGVRGMREGGVRQLIIPAELSYDGDKKLGPRPTTPGGNQALNVVMDDKGGLMDKTLLVNVAVKRVYQNS